MSSRREILVTFTNLEKEAVQPDSFWLFLFLSDSPMDKKLKEVSESSELVRTDIY